MELHALTIQTAHDGLMSGAYLVKDLVDACLKNIEQKNDELNVYLSMHDDIDAQVERAQSMIDRGEAHLLTGIPCALKANILRKGQKASAGSKVLEPYRATYSATVVERLEDKGVIFLGATNMDEFAMGSSTENSAFGPTKNPHDPARVPGGSSGGSAAALAADMCVFALGSDTGGSIRQPAALCGLVGSKTTYGAVSRHGAIAMGSSLDQIGPFTKTIEGARAVTAVMAGKDTFDMTSIDVSMESGEQKNMKILVPHDGLEQVDPDTRERFESIVDGLIKEGHEVAREDVPMLGYGLPVYYIMMPAEVSSNLARYDGIRYGERVEGKNLLETYLNSRSSGFGAETKRRIMLGTYILSKGYEDRLYTSAIAMKEHMKSRAKELFETHDMILTPTTLGPAFKFGEKTDNPLDMYAEDLFTVSANIIGAPAISVPMGSVKKDGKNLPVGLHIMTAARNDAEMFSMARTIESVISDIL